MKWNTILVLVIGIMWLVYAILKYYKYYSIFCFKAYSRFFDKKLYTLYRDAKKDIDSIIKVDTIEDLGFEVGRVYFYRSNIINVLIREDENGDIVMLDDISDSTAVFKDLGLCYC